MEKINFKDLPNTSTPINATNLNAIQTNTENAINGIIDSGSNDNGKWIKFSDGTMICMVTKTKNGFYIDNSHNNVYYKNYDTKLLFPVEFIEKPIVNISAISSTTNSFWIGGVGVQNITNDGVQNIGFFAPYERYIDFTLNIIAIGRWK